MRAMHRALILLISVLLIFMVITQKTTLYSSYKRVTRPLQPSKHQVLSPSTSTQVETRILGSELVPGFSLLDRLYLRNGTFFIVTANRSTFPPKRNIIAPGVNIGAGHSIEPTDKELQIIDPEEAVKVLGQSAIQIDGLSVVVYDTTQYMAHYYHWWGEIIFGFWRVYSGMFSTISPPPPFPARFILPFVHENEWHDHAGIDAPLMRASFPSATIEHIDYWEDLAILGRTVVFDRAMIVSRESSARHPFAAIWFKMIASAMSINPVPDFFEPIRRTVITNLLGYLPILDTQGAVTSIATSHVDNDVQIHDVLSDLPIVTYVSRQGGDWRKLGDTDHEGLVQALNDLEKEGVCKVNVVRLETMDFKEQVALAARSTILLGVHGNGLTHQLWMPPSPRSTVMEIFIPNGFLFDYEILARNLRHRHYIVWNDTLMTYSNGSYHPVRQVSISRIFALKAHCFTERQFSTGFPGALNTSSRPLGRASHSRTACGRCGFGQLELSGVREWVSAR